MNMFCGPEKPVFQLQQCGLQLKVMLELAIYVMVFQCLGPAVAEDSVYNPLVAICPCNSFAWQDLPELRCAEFFCGVGAIADAFRGAGYAALSLDVERGPALCLFMERGERQKCRCFLFLSVNSWCSRIQLT